MRKLINLMLLLPSIIYTSSIDSNVFKYFPLNAGNRWTWYIDQFWNPGPGYETMKITGSQNINNHVYFTAKTDIYYFYQNQHYVLNSYLRIDSLTGNLFNYNVQNQTECLYDSLNSKRNDSAYITCLNRWYRCDTGTYYIFNQYPKSKEFSWSNYFEAGGFRTYSLNFGRVYEVYSTVHGSTHWLLRGCLINGILYGDTNLYIGISKISSEVPKNFVLYQNYPNPFNPATKIRFSIPLSRGVDAEGRQGVLLIVYDVLGREITTLVNEKLSPGTYEVEFDPEKSGQAGLSSGIYYYTLTAGDYIETKKMILIK